LRTRRSRRALLVVVLFSTACSLSTIGLLQGGGGSDAGAGDATTPDARPTLDGAGADGMADALDAPPPDAASDAALDCGALAAPIVDAGLLAAQRLAGDASITVNGNLDDWGCVPFVPLTRQTAG
jgi:hypothetical protein